MQYTIDYLGGHPLMNKPEAIYITINADYKAIYFRPKSSWSTTKPVTIESSEIVSIDFEKQTSRSAGKAVTGALIGGVLTGGIGLLVGGALGAHKKNNSELYITIVYNERNFTIALKTGKYTDKIYSEINGLFA